MVPPRTELHRATIDKGRIPADGLCSELQRQVGVYSSERNIVPRRGSIVFEGAGNIEGPR